MGEKSRLFTNNFECISIVRKGSYRYKAKVQKLRNVGFIFGIPGNQLNSGVLFLYKVSSRVLTGMPLTISASFSNE